MTLEPNDARHQTFANLDKLWSAGNPQVLPVHGSPWCEIRLDPGQGVVRLRTDYSRPEPDVAKLRNITFTPLTDSGRELAEFTVRVDEGVHGAYSLLASVADCLQLNGQALAQAFATGLAEYRDVLAPRSRLTDAEETGLVGELLVLEHLVDTTGASSALDAWVGSFGGEHDYVFPDLHLEVKTTVSERRRHVIGTLEQLVPVGDVPLCLLSIQLTRASQASGRTLPTLISHLRDAVGGHVLSLDNLLDQQGWRANEADLYSTPWALRSTPRAYLVDASFPALTPGRLGPVVPRFGLVSDVSYRVDVTDIKHIDMAGPLAGFIERRDPRT